MKSKTAHNTVYAAINWTIRQCYRTNIYIKLTFLHRNSLKSMHRLTRCMPVVETLNFEKSRIIYWLFKLRGIPVPESLTLKGLEKINFVKLEAVPNKEVIIGLIGQFWTPTGRLKRFKPEEFINFDKSDFAKSTWNFELTESQ